MKSTYFDFDFGCDLHSALSLWEARRDFKLSIYAEDELNIK